MNKSFETKSGEGHSDSSIIKQVQSDPEKAYNILWSVGQLRNSFRINRGRFKFCESLLWVYDIFLRAEILEALNADYDLVNDTRDEACEAQWTIFAELGYEGQTIKHYIRAIELYEQCTVLVAKYIREAGHERGVYFKRMEAADEEAELVLKGLNHGLSKLKQEKKLQNHEKHSKLTES